MDPRVFGALPLVPEDAINGRRSTAPHCRPGPDRSPISLRHLQPIELVQPEQPDRLVLVAEDDIAWAIAEAAIGDDQHLDLAPDVVAPGLQERQIGRASCRDKMGLYVKI